jgi:hypothetical protein
MRKFPRFVLFFFLIFHTFLISFMRVTYLQSPSFIHPNDSGEQYKSYSYTHCLVFSYVLLIPSASSF